MILLDNNRNAYCVSLVVSDKTKFYPLLLLADETTEAIDKYLFDGDHYQITSDGITVGVFCLYPIGTTGLELKNIAISSSLQGSGIGSAALSAIKQLAQANKYTQLFVGTPDIAVDQLRFYKRNGFIAYSIRKDFYILNYPLPIIEQGVRLRDMIVLRFIL